MATVLATGMAGCASVDGSNGFRDTDEISENDPLEGLNRQIFAANLAVDTFLLRPAAVGYREIVPDFGKDMIRNFLNNLRAPLILINDLAQGEGARAQTTLSRFMVNTFIGVGGLFDPASDMGLAYHSEDVGQTLATYGVDEGPYLVLPILGPSNARDAVGTAIGWLIDPVRVVAEAADADEALYARAIAEGVDLRYRLMPAYDELRQNSLDFYAFTRSAYRQRRTQDIRNVGASGGVFARKDDGPALPPSEGAAPVLTAEATALRAEPAPAAGADVQIAAVPAAAAPAELPAALPKVDPLFIEPRPTAASAVDPRFIEPRPGPAQANGDTAAAGAPGSAGDRMSDASPASDVGPASGVGMSFPTVDPIFIEPRPPVTSVTATAAETVQAETQLAAIPPAPATVQAQAAAEPAAVVSERVPENAPQMVGQPGAPTDVNVAALTPAASLDAPEAPTGLAEEALAVHQAALKAYEDALRSAQAATRNEQVQQ